MATGKCRNITTANVDMFYDNIKGVDTYSYSIIFSNITGCSVRRSYPKETLFGFGRVGSKRRGFFLRLVTDCNKDCDPSNNAGVICTKSDVFNVQLIDQNLYASLDDALNNKPQKEMSDTHKKLWDYTTQPPIIGAYKKFSYLADIKGNLSITEANTKVELVKSLICGIWPGFSPLLYEYRCSKKDVCKTCEQDPVGIIV